MLKAPLRERTESDVDDAFPMLSASDCTAEGAADGAADAPRDHRPVREGVLWASRPVEAERVNSDCCCTPLLSPEAVGDDIASLVRLDW